MIAAPGGVCSEPKATLPAPDDTPEPDDTSEPMFRVWLRYQDDDEMLPGYHTYAQAVKLATTFTDATTTVDIVDAYRKRAAHAYVCSVCSGRARIMNKEAQWEQCFWCNNGVMIIKG